MSMTETLGAKKQNLHEAVKEHDLTAVEKLLDENAQLQPPDSDFSHATNIAAEKGYTEILLTLLTRITNKEIQDKFARRSARFCAKFGKAETLWHLLSWKADFEAPDRNKQTLLHICAIHGNTEAALILLEWGANISAPDKWGQRPLHHCAWFEMAETALMLTERGADVSAVTNACSTPLHFSAISGCREIASALIEKGADVNAQNSYGRTPMHLAILRKREDVALALLKAGARLSIVDADNKRPLDYDTGGTLIEKIIAFLLGHARNEGIQLPETDRHEQSRDTLALHASNELPDNQGDDRISQKEGKTEAIERHESTNCGAWTDPKINDQQASGSRQDTAHRNSLRNPPEPHKRIGSLKTASTKYSTSSDEYGFDSFSLDDECLCGDNQARSQREMLRSLEKLKSETIFHERYVIVAKHVAGRMHIRFAESRFDREEMVALKFYWSKAMFEKAKNTHIVFRRSKHIYRLIEPVDNEPELPPCLVLEVGMYTLTEWLLCENPGKMARKWCLSEILTGICDIHASKRVHCDIKPSNIMFFVGRVTWKLIDLDEMRDEGEGSTVRFTPAYAPPEVIMGTQRGERMPIIKTSIDMWAFGILTYEVLEDKRFYSDAATAEDVACLLESGIIQDNLSKVEDKACRRALNNLLTIDPHARWTAARTLEAGLFRSDKQTTTT